ncbi:hypothetical protein C8Q74DRAFT_387737 [Fomes fomentarius]|nr:hypothetical protein C8Q74DRAFT_387737 [Fomes fomentarius]
MQSSRPLRSSPLAGPSIAASKDGTLSAPATPRGSTRHLSPLAEFSTTATDEDDDAASTSSKKHRRRSLGVVLSKISFPSSASDSPELPATSHSLTARTRSKSASARAVPPAVPPLPAWVAQGGAVSPPSARSPASPGSASPKSKSRPSSPTPSGHSTGSRKSVFEQVDPRTGSPVRLAPSTSRNPEENWLTQSAAPRFSRLGLKAEGVVLPVSAREARRRSTASTLTVRAKSLEAVPPPLPVRMHARTSPRASLAGVPRPGSVASITNMGVPVRPMSVRSATAPTPSSSTLPPATPPRQHRSRTSSFASASSSSGRLSVDCDTPSLTMSPGPSASDVSLAQPLDPLPADELGVLAHTHTHDQPPELAQGHGHGHSNNVQTRLNDVPVGIIELPKDAYHGAGKGKSKSKGDDTGLETYKEREREHRVSFGTRPHTATSVASVGSLNSVGSVYTLPVNVHIQWSDPGSPRGSERSSYLESVYARHGRAATSPELFLGAGKEGEAEKRRTKPTATIGRLWKHVVRSVSARR